MSGLLRFNPRTVAVRGCCRQQGWLAAFPRVAARVIAGRLTRFADLGAEHPL